MLNTILQVPGVGFSIAGLDRAKFGFYRFQSFLFIVVTVVWILLKTTCWQTKLVRGENFIKISVWSPKNCIAETPEDWPKVLFNEKSVKNICFISCYKGILTRHRGVLNSNKEKNKTIKNGWDVFHSRNWVLKN